jgi:hypothetical protein
MPLQAGVGNVINMTDANNNVISTGNIESPDWSGAPMRASLEKGRYAASEIS